MRDILIFVGVSITILAIAYCGIRAVDDVMWDIIIAIFCALPIAGLLLYKISKE